MKLLLDMNLSPRWVAFLAAEGIQAVHWSSVGGHSSFDSEIMSFARNGGYTVLTQDLDFSTILAATGGTKPSVVQIRSDNLSPSAIGANVIEVLRRFAAELEAGALISVEPHRARVRVLPLTP
jgi:predicted nuclease of predicted toxin-antitoxin system